MDDNADMKLCDLSNFSNVITKRHVRERAIADRVKSIQKSKFLQIKFEEELLKLKQ